MFDFLFKKEEVIDTSIKKEVDNSLKDEKINIRLPEIKNNMIVELLDDNKTVVTEAKVSFHNFNQIDFIRLPGMLSLPIFDIGSELMIRGITLDENYFLLKGKVYESTKLKLVIKEQIAIDSGSKRANVRYNINNEATLYYDRQGTNIEEKVILVDISLNGACIRTSLDLDNELVYRLRVELYKGAGLMSFNCQIVRKMIRDDLVYDYGMLFEELDNHKLNYLKYDLDELHRRLS